MRYIVLVCLIGLGLAFGVCLIGARLSDPLASFDPYHPATLFQQVRELRVSDLVDTFIAPHRERIRRDALTQSLPR